MAKRVQDHKPPRTAEVQAWMKSNVADQKKRYAAIVKEMNSLSRDRDKWYAEFLRIIQTKGYNINGDQRVVIPAKLVPKKPKGKGHNRVNF